MSNRICAVDLFCGAGGLTYGLRRAGIHVSAGVDIDSRFEYAFTENNPESRFYSWDLAKKKTPSIESLFNHSKYRLLAGCAPCTPFSKLTQAIHQHQAWDLLAHFGRFARGMKPHLLTMENVPELAGRGSDVFEDFLCTLDRHGYHCDWKIVECHEYGVPQSRRRLVLLASQLGPIKVPRGTYRQASKWKTVRQTIGNLPPLNSGESCDSDLLHVAPELSPMNLRRIKATPHDGGSRKSWPKKLVLDCHKKKSGERYYSIYGRMWWDRPAPTMTTLCTGIGNGRFGHPEQNRSITLREAALFQSFPRKYKFWPKQDLLNRRAVGMMIGNAVPPRLAQAVGRAIVRHVDEYA